LKEILRARVKDDAILFPWDNDKFNEAFAEMKKDLAKPLSESRISVRAVGHDVTFHTTYAFQYFWTICWNSTILFSHHSDTKYPLPCLIKKKIMEHIWYLRLDLFFSW